jgi:SAM-dependent MidA family methyltransferase
MTAAGEFLRDEVARTGPILFRRFMQVALYHPDFGYYRRHDPFGKSGDFFTAAQLQPVFGILMASTIRKLHAELGRPADFAVVDLGAGRAEMAEAFPEWRYVAVDVDRGELPVKITGVVFANEFFDALPVDAAVHRGNRFHMLRVGLKNERFIWIEAEEASSKSGEYLTRYGGSMREGERMEIALDALDWMDRIAASVREGYLMMIDYGYTTRELARFPQGTLMSYRRHTAHEDVLERPGEQDITAHVPFTAMEEHATEAGLQRVKFERLSETLLAAGEEDKFAAALSASTEEEEARRRLQLKTLLFGMGETFRTLLLRKGQ